MSTWAKDIEDQLSALRKRIEDLGPITGKPTIKGFASKQLILNDNLDVLRLKHGELDSRYYTKQEVDTEIEDAFPGLDGSGLLNYLAKWTPDTDSIGSSMVYDNGSGIGVGTVHPSSLLDIEQPAPLAAETVLLELTNSSDGTSTNTVTLLAIQQRHGGVDYGVVKIGGLCEGSFGGTLSRMASFLVQCMHNGYVNDTLRVDRHGTIYQHYTGVEWFTDDEVTALGTTSIRNAKTLYARDTGGVGSYYGHAREQDVYLDNVLTTGFLNRVQRLSADTVPVLEDIGADDIIHEWYNGGVRMVLYGNGDLEMSTGEVDTVPSLTLKCSSSTLETSLTTTADTAGETTATLFNAGPGGGNVVLSTGLGWLHLHDDGKVSFHHYDDVSDTNEIGYINDDADGLGMEVMALNGDLLLTSSAGNVVVSPLSANTSSNVVTHIGGTLGTRAPDSRVWGTSLVDGSGTAGILAVWADTSTLADVEPATLGAALAAYGSGSSGLSSDADMEALVGKVDAIDAALKALGIGEI